MKKLITILLFLLTITSYGQKLITITINGVEQTVEFTPPKSEIVGTNCEAETVIFRMLNEYRKSQDKSIIQHSKCAYETAYHHAYYLGLDGVEYSHDETVDVPGFDEIITKSERIEKYCGSGFGVECIASINLNYNSFVVTTINLEEACKRVVDLWVASPSHKEGLLYDLDLGSVSVVMKDNGIGLVVLVLVSREN
tara:strand:- start:558 stop:1145 length:588 start_codon:yes stop_codon:yes gene_type:complete